MRTSDSAPQPLSVAAASEFNPLIPINDGQFAPVPVAIPLADRLKAIGLVTLVSTLGIGSVLLGARLLSQNAEESLFPIAETNQDTSQPSIRARTPVITSSTPVNRPAVSPETTRLEQQRQSPQLTTAETNIVRTNTVRTNRDFGAIAPPETIAVNPIPAGSVQPQRQTSPTTVQAGSRASNPTQPNPSPPQTAARPFPVELIAALLQAPQPTGSSIAIVPRPILQPVIPPTIPPQPGSTSTATRPFPTIPSTPTASSSPATPSTSTKPANIQPSLTQPGAIAQPNPSTSTPSQPGNTTSPTTEPAAPAQPAIPPVVTVKPPVLKDRIPVDQVQITGSTRFSQQELVAIVSKIMTAPDSANPGATTRDRTLSPAELVQASEAITKLYTDRGYINSGAFVPADVLTGATPEIRVVEGKLEAINVQVQRPNFLWFARPLSPNYVRRRLNRFIQTPLQIDQLADAVRLLEQDPMIATISTELAPGTTLGKSTLNVKVRQASPLKVTLSVDNGRAPSVGTFRQQVGLSHMNFLGLGDRLQVGYNRSAGSESLDLGFSVPINSSNGTLSLAYTTSRGEVIQEPFRELGIKSRSQNYEIALRQPIFQTANEFVALSLRGTHYRNEGQFLEAFNDGVAIPFPARGSDIDGKTRITAIRFGQEWLKRSERDVFSLQSEFSLGVNAINSTQLEEPPDGRFFSWQGRGFWVHSFAPDTLFALKGQLQFANRPLVPVEQLSLGGIDTIRGYRTSVLLADNAWFASAEFYLPVLRIPRWRGVLQVVPFIDAGRGWNQGFEQPDPSHLLSVGLGLQWKMGDNFRARLDWGTPLINSTAINGQSLRESLFFSVIYTP